MSLEGMDTGVVQTLVTALGRHATTLNQTAGQVGRLTGQLRSSWRGADAARFDQLWQSQYRAALQAAANTLSEMQRSLTANLQQQTTTSSVGTEGSGALSRLVPALAGGVAIAGGLVTGLNDEFDPLSKAKSIADVTQSHFFDDANAPVKGFIGDILEDGRIKAIGKGMDFVSYGAQGYELYHDYQQGDYLEMGLDGADDVGGQLKGHFGLPGYLGGVAVNQWTDVVRDAEKVDWNLEGDDYAKYMNPFVAKNWTQTILPGAWDGLKQGAGQTLENLLP